MYRHILVPVDDSDLSIDTASKAVEFAKALGARITFFHARPDFGATEDGALVRVMSPRQFAEHAAGNARALLAKAESAARDSGISFESVAKTSDRPYEVIIDAAEECGCDLIFMASHGPRGLLKGLMLGSQTQRVLVHARIPVLVCAVESNAQSAEANKVISIVQGEHRSVAAVIHALKQAMRKARDGGARVDLRLLRAAIQYFRALSARHAQAVELLFGPLCARLPDAAKLLSRLEGQHDDLAVLLQALETALGEYQASPDPEHMNRLVPALESYAERQWEHIRVEEGSLLPECREHLTDEEWKQIAQTFEKSVGGDRDQHRERAFEALFSDIMKMCEKITHLEGELL